MNTFYKEKEHLQKLKKCNKCGKILKTEQQMEKWNEFQEKFVIGQTNSSMITIEIPWGYFSGKDGEVHKIILCEDCYDEWIRGFQIPVEIMENVEWL